jgi:probable HAF family extracellular repeat protein
MRAVRKQNIKLRAIIMWQKFLGARPFRHERVNINLASGWVITRRCAFGLTLTIACQCALAQAMYRIKPLGFLHSCNSSAPVAEAMNAAGQVTGWACKANSYQHAFLWKNNGGPMIDLGPSEKGSESVAYSINASGMVAGTATDSKGTYGFTSSGAAMTKIPDGLGGTFTRAYGLNDSGQVTGEAENGPPNEGTTDAFLWKQGSPMIDLGGYAATLWPETYGLYVNASGQVAGGQFDGDRSGDTFIWLNDGSPAIYLTAGEGITAGPAGINASAQVVGDFSVNGYAHPHTYVWRNDNTGMHDLGTLPGGDLSAPWAQNDSGQIVGASWVAYFKKARAFVWMNNGTPLKNLGSFGGTNSEAHDINASGEVTGWADISGDAAQHAFLWSTDGRRLQDLNTLVDPLDPLKPYVTLTSGDHINVSGDIVATGTDSRSGKSDLYLLQRIR